MAVTASFPVQSSLSRVRGIAVPFRPPSGVRRRPLHVLASGEKTRDQVQTRRASCLSSAVEQAARRARDALAGTALAVALSASVAVVPPSLALVPGNSPLPPPQAVEKTAPVPVPDDGGATAVLDYGRVLSVEARTALEAEVDALERESEEHWKLRIVTAYGAGSAPSIPALEKYWGADSRTVIMSWDEFKGNVLEFYYPTSFSTVPRAVFQELRGRYGNLYFVDEEGTEESVKRVSRVLVDCLTDGGCTFVPGLSEQQRLFSLVPITSGAFLSGGALRQGIRNRWSVIFLLLWAPWIVGFGYYPLYIRQPEDITPLIENTLVFAAIFALTAYSPILGGGSREETRPLLGSMGRPAASMKGDKKDGGEGKGEREGEDDTKDP